MVVQDKTGQDRIITGLIDDDDGSIERKKKQKGDECYSQWSAVERRAWASAGL